MPATDTGGDEILGVLLAGGQARRMGGGDKALRLLGGRTILRRIIDRMAPQLNRMIINANGDPARFAEFGLPVAADVVAGQVGPLAGVLTGLEWASAHMPDCRSIITMPTDAPFLPADMVVSLRQAQAQSRSGLVCAESAGRRHPVIGLWPLDLMEDLREAIVTEGIRKIDRWTDRHGCASVAWPASPVDPFMNVNRPEDLSLAENLLRSSPDPV